MNSGAVLTNEDLGEKSFLFSDEIFPRVSILDPELTCSIPAALTASGAADALSHILESYFSSADDCSPVQERLQEALAAAIMDQTLAVLDDPLNVQKRASLQWAITLAHNGWVKAGVKYAAPMHLIGHVLSARHDVAHGSAMAIMMPAWMKTVCVRRTGKFSQFASRVFTMNAAAQTAAGLAAEGISRFEDHLKKSGVPVRLSELPGLHLGEKELAAIRDDVIRLSFDETGLLPGNPKLGSDEVLELLRIAR
jgi:alcohol dehydrogenase